MQNILSLALTIKKIQYHNAGEIFSKSGVHATYRAGDDISGIYMTNDAEYDVNLGKGNIMTT